MSYGWNVADSFRKAAGHVDKILKGARPADLPVERPTRFDFALNLQAAQALGLTFPQSVLQQATDRRRALETGERAGSDSRSSTRIFQSTSSNFSTPCRLTPEIAKISVPASS